ncbi:MAG: YebC/PmpR family DNA-binding transcriptional regulator [Oscillospiraceae bacterium]|jgi:YebC/PmpR family DNA-binding regulatory protein|nr:YebC/PmpR family DNA-binding transcriptional regulator [Oscillospiraceae bacterium]
MSGHSKWNNIRERKGKTDAQRAKVFTKISREIIVAVKEGGGSPASNARLRDAIAKARASNIPNDNIKRVIDKASSAGDSSSYESCTYEGYGPGGVAVIVETTTDNRNRTASEVRHAFDKYGGNLGAQGSVAWNFDRKGVLRVASDGLDEDAVMESALDSGASDFGLSTDDGEDGEIDVFEILTEPDALGAVRERLDAAGYAFTSAQVEFVPRDSVELTDDEDLLKLGKLLDMLEDNDDVQNVFCNLK